MMKRLLIFALALYLFQPIFGCGKGANGPEGSVSANPLFDQLAGQWFAETPNADGEIIVLRFENKDGAHTIAIEAIRPSGEKVPVDSGTFDLHDKVVDFAMTKLGPLSAPYAIETTPQERLTIESEVYVKVNTQGPTLSGQIRLTQLSADEFVTVASIVPPHVPGEIIVKNGRSGSQALASGRQAMAIEPQRVVGSWRRIRLDLPEVSALTVPSKKLGERARQLRDYEGKVLKIEREALERCREEGNTCSYNVILKAQGVPNDPKWGDQWNLKLLNMMSVFEDQVDEFPAPRRKVVVAVIDTGIVSTHDDIKTKLLRSDGRVWGYDFVTHITTNLETGAVKDDNFSLDNDGPDSDPADPGDERYLKDPKIPDTISSWHGTHLAAIIAAARDNGVGIAGMNESVEILPIRSVGRNGQGSTFDVAQGILYACRLPNLGDCDFSYKKDAQGNFELDPGGNKQIIPGDDGNYLEESTCRYTYGRVEGAPERPVADVINLSLGLAMPLDDAKALLEAINACYANDPARKPPVIIAAAGNDHLGPGYCFDEPTQRFVANPNCQFYPAAHPKVIPVGAVAGSGAFASSYSNYSPRQFVVAPGGSPSQGVLSAVHPLAADGYWDLVGTSQAAAHVSGLASLILSYKPDLPYADVSNIIADTATYLGNAAEGQDDQFGHGLINPRGALFNALGMTPQGEPKLATSVKELDFGSYGENATVIVYNSGGGALDILDYPVITDDGGGWLTVQKKKLDDPTGTAPWALQIKVDRSKVNEGRYFGKVILTTTGGGRQEIDVSMKVESFSVSGATEVDNLIRKASDLLGGQAGFQNTTNFGDLYVFAVNVDNEQKYYVKTNFEANYNFYMMVPPGKYNLVAGVDANNDKKICSAEDAICLGYPTFIQPQAIDCTNGCNPGNIAITY